MGRKRIVPIESRTLKYFYIIIVKFHKQKLIKFGVTNNFVRRFREYNNKDTIGKFEKVLHLYKCEFPKRIEYSIKWKLTKFAKPVFKQEYFETKHYDKIHEMFHKFVETYGYKAIEIIDIENYYKDLLKKR